MTTQTLNRGQLAQLSEEVGEERTLLICCTAFRANRDEFSNLTIRKIPKMVLDRCEFGKDDYSLQVSSLPQAPEGTGDQVFGGPGIRGRESVQVSRRSGARDDGPTLLDLIDGGPHTDGPEDPNTRIPEDLTPGGVE